MYSLETGIVLSVAALFFYSFLTFTFLRETNISREVLNKYESEKINYEIGNDNAQLLNRFLVENDVDVLGTQELVREFIDRIKETIKLNYGIDYTTGWCHFNPIPDTWYKMRDILLFWAAKGVETQAAGVSGPYKAHSTCCTHKCRASRVVVFPLLKKRSGFRSWQRTKRHFK